MSCHLVQKIHRGSTVRVRRNRDRRGGIQEGEQGRCRGGGVPLLPGDVRQVADVRRQCARDVRVQAVREVD